MADSRGVLQRVLKLEECLSYTQDPRKIRKALKRLQELEISLDILAETGVGKTVNSFRKHATVGVLAQSLISRWKKLVPQEKASEPPKIKHSSENENETSNKSTRRLRSKDKNKPSEKFWSSESSCKIYFSSDMQKKAQGLKDKPRNHSEHICTGCKDRQKSSEKHSIAVNKSSKKNRPSTSNRKDSSPLEIEKSGKDPSTKQIDTQKEIPKSNSRSKSPVNSATGEDFEPPIMSFESYLNYDQALCRRKGKAYLTGRQVANGNHSSAFQKGVTLSTNEENRRKLKSEEYLATPGKKAKTSLQELLNTPLPKDLPEITISSPPYAMEFKAPLPLETPQQKSETAPFMGRRSITQMQVYSGSKVACLSKMLTLYEQCIRVLQNNINSLHEVGGVPFEILEPVLTRCTPEQLFRIEDCNPTFVEESDHLWKKHCQKVFRNEQLLECESWRQMYLRLFNQREEKLKSLTQSILSAQSERRKGHQIKMAFIHGMPKPPRNIRRQQEKYGTSGSVVQRQSESKNPEKRKGSNGSSGLSSTKGTNVASTCSSIYTNGPAQNGKKLPKNIAPIMRKSLRAFKNRVGPR